MELHVLNFMSLYHLPRLILKTNEIIPFFSFVYRHMYTCHLNLFGLLIINRNLYLTVLKAGKAKISGMFGVWWKLTSWFLVIFLFCSLMEDEEGSCHRPLMQEHQCHSWELCPQDLNTKRLHFLITSHCELEIQHNSFKGIQTQYIKHKSQTQKDLYVCVFVYSETWILE
jgi:hypothetical protein